MGKLRFRSDELARDGARDVSKPAETGLTAEALGKAIAHALAPLIARNAAPAELPPAPAKHAPPRLVAGIDAGDYEPPKPKAKPAAPAAVQAPAVAVVQPKKRAPIALEVRRGKNGLIEFIDAPGWRVVFNRGPKGAVDSIAIVPKE